MTTVLPAPASQAGAQGSVWVAPTRIGAAIKVLVMGGYASGKTTFVNTASSMDPVTADVTVTAWPDSQPPKPMTTSGLDFGRSELQVAGKALTVCLFGIPGLSRFWPGLWPQIAVGAVGAVVLVDPCDVGGCFTAIDHCEQEHIPYLVCVNRPETAPVHGPDELRRALAIGEQVPIGSCDVRNRHAATAIVASLVEHGLNQRRRRL